MAKNKKKFLVIGGISFASILLIAVAGLLIFNFSDGNQEETWKPPSDSDKKMGEEKEVENESTSDDDEFILNEKNNTETSDNDNTKTTTIDEDENKYPDAPLFENPTWFRVKSSLPSANSYWSSEMGNSDPKTWVDDNPEYYVLEDAKVRVYQDIPEIEMENYITSGTTSENGYTKQLNLEASQFSSFNNKDGKAYAIVENEHIVSKIGKLGYTFDVPEESDKVVVLNAIPDTYGFSTLLTVSDEDLTDIQNVDNLNIEQMRPCAASSSWGWNLASLTQLLYEEDFEVQLSTKSDGDWKKQSFSTIDSADKDTGYIHIVLRPQILTDEEEQYTGYDGTPFDMETTGEKEFYVKFRNGLTSKIYKVNFDLTPTDIDNIEFKEVK